MKRTALACLLLLAACGSREEAARQTAAEATNMAAPVEAPARPDDDLVDCAVGGAAAFERSCTIERSDTPQGRILTLRAPDGGFRRLRVTKDGSGVIAADGAQPARVTILSPERIEVAIGADRYRLPATIRR